MKITNMNIWSFEHFKIVNQLKFKQEYFVNIWMEEEARELVCLVLTFVMIIKLISVEMRSQIITMTLSLYNKLRYIEMIWCFTKQLIGYGRSASFLYNFGDLSFEQMAKFTF